MAPNTKYSSHLAHAQTKCPYQWEIDHRYQWNVIESWNHVFFQKTSYHGNHITHLVAPPKSKAIALLREQVGEIFSNSYITCYYVASSANGQDDPNRALWLATRADKMEQSCPLGTTRCIPKAKLPWKPYNKSFIDRVCSVKMAGYWRSEVKWSLYLSRVAQNSI